MLPEEVEHWSLTTLREKLIMIARADVLACAWTAILGTKPSDDAAHPSCRGERPRHAAAVSYQGALIMTHRDGFPRFSARSAWRGDAGRRKPCAPSECHGPSESLGKPPLRSRGRTGSGRIGGGVGKP